jgi:hypothetical protein
MVAIVIASGDPSFGCGVGVRRKLMGRGHVAAYIELENAGDHNDGLRPITILKHCEPERLNAVDEKSAAGTFFVLDDPVTSAIPADPET